MSKIDTKTLERAFIPAGTPMLAEIMERVGATADLDPVRKRDMLSGLRRVGKAIGRAPEEIPAHPAWLQKRIEKVAPAALNLSPKSWANALSDARAGLALCGIVERRQLGEPLGANWQKLWKAVLASKDRSLVPLLRFVRFLSRMGVDPKRVADEHAAAFRLALQVNEISKDPEVAYRAAVNMWNLAGNRIATWPRQRLTLPSRKKTIAVDLTTFPASFSADLARFVSSLEAPDPFDTRARPAPLRPQTVAIYRQRMLRFASILVHSGVDAAQIIDIAAVVTSPNIERGLRWMLSRSGNALTREVSEMAGFLAKAARSFVRVSEAEQKQIDRLRDRVFLKPKQGMTDKNRDRLRPFDDPRKVRDLLFLPERLFERGMKGTSYRSALEREDAVAIALFLHCPIRRGNAVSIHLEENFQRFGHDRAFLVFEADEVKNSERIEFELPDPLRGMIERHLAARVPQLCPPGTPWLFPRRDGLVHMDANQFADRIKSRIFKEFGIKMNAHLFRHFAAKVLLTARPGQYEALRRLLGHKELTQTINSYAGFEAGTATRLFAEAIEEAKR